MRNKALFLFLFLCSIAYSTFAQKADSTKNISHFSGTASITNNGISLIPTFSLNKPAALFNMSMGKSKFSFDPEFNFSLEGKPWYFLFWFRYKLANTNQFRMGAGTHLGLNFKTADLPVNGDSSEVTITERYLSVELSPNYSISKNVNIGIYYLYSRGLDVGTIRNSNFITINATFSNIRVVNMYLVKIVPQFYYLRQNEDDGFYFTAALTVSRNNFPLSISSVINKVIQTDILAGEDFVWNITLTYSFGKKYVEL